MQRVVKLAQLFNGLTRNKPRRRGNQVSVECNEISSSFVEPVIAHTGHKSSVRILELPSNAPNGQVNEQSLTFAFTASFSSTTLSPSPAQLSKMTAMKRALLIASPFGGLLGPLNDVQTMEAVLKQQGFEILSCYDAKATRQGIIDAWKSIIEVSQPGDIVLIYYSGHGGIVEDVENKPRTEKKKSPTQQQSWRYQFLVPMDFSLPDPPAADAASSFNGILDVELEDLLRRTTARTENVTTIFDCCHSGRMARDPSHAGAVPRNIPKVQYAAVSRKVDHLREANGNLTQANLHEGGNQDAVRIAAAGALETAWEDGDGDQRAGVMTRELSRALHEAWEATNHGNQISWHKIMLRVRELVNINFPRQNPHVEGPRARMVFSLEKSETNAIILKPDGERGILKAGWISGVRVNNVYTLMPLGSERVSDETQIGEATVTAVDALEATAKLSLVSVKASIPPQGVMAFLVKESLRQLPVAHPDGPAELLDAIDGSKYLCRRDVHNAPQDIDLLARFERDERRLTLTDSKGRRLLSQQVSDDNPKTWASASDTLVKQAEQLARANHLLNITCKEKEKLSHALSVTFGTMKEGKPHRIVETDGEGKVTEGEQVYISITNNGPDTTHISAFDINVSGKISLVSNIDVPATRAYHIGAGQYRDEPLGEGLTLSWPRDISKAQPIPESLVLVLTDSHVDLSVLESDARAEGKGEAGPSALEQLIFRLATGAQRDLGKERVKVPLKFDVLHIPFEILAQGASGTPEAGISSGQHGVNSSSWLQVGELSFLSEVVNAGDLPPSSPYLDRGARVSSLLAPWEI